MANPFLFGDEDMEDAGAEAAVNPFLLGDTDAGEDAGESDNPFGGPNPFAFGGDDSGDVPTTMAEILQGEDTATTTQASSRSNDHVMNFFSTTIDEADEPRAEETKNDVEEELNKEPRGSIPPSKTTQDLIETVAGHLEQTSTELLERLPATRSPSPISMRDIASPSPTPDSAFGDLMDYSDSAPSSMQGFDNPFGAPTSVQQVQAPPPVPPVVRAQPPRPPPPRPIPPRPTPPVPPAPVHQAPQEQPDLFDVHETAAVPSRPPPPKSTDDILSLYDPKPKTTQQPDLLTDDIDLKEETQPEKKQSPPKELAIFPVEEKPMEELTVKENRHAMRRAPTPDIEVTTCPDNPRSDDEEEEQQQQEEVKPAQSDSASPPTESSPPATTDITTPHTSEPEQMDTGLDFAPPSGVSSANPFASPDEDEETFPPSAAVTNIFGAEETNAFAPETETNAFAVEEPVATNIFAAVEEPVATNIFAAVEEPVATNIFADPTSIFAAEPDAPVPIVNNIFGDEPDEFDAFAAKFESAKTETGILEGFRSVTPLPDAWGDDAFGGGSVTDSGLDDGFGSAEGDDPFLSMKAPPRTDSVESIDKGFSVSIRSKEGIKAQGPAPHIAPPPPQRGVISDRVNPFDKGEDRPDVIPAHEEIAPIPGLERTDSQDTPQTPLFDEDVSQPLEEFPRIHYEGDGWEMQLRQPNKKKITGQRFWKKIFVRMVYQEDKPVVQLYNQASDKQPFQEVALQPSYSVSDIGAQQFDQFGKIFTMKLQYILYKERPGVRPGQITKAERITTKLSQFAHYAIAGDYAGVKEFGSDLKKLGLPVEHAPQSSQLAKLGSMTYEDMKQFSVTVEEALFKLNSHRDRALNYKMEEVQVTAVDEFYVEQDFDGTVRKQIARVRLFFLAFLSGMPGIELGLNDMWRQGREVVGRHDIIPVVTEEWIRLEAVEFHNTVNLEEYERSRTIKFQPPDAQYIELMRFRVRPPKNRELPLQLKATWCVTGNKVELRADVLVPGFASRKLGQIPCEDVSIRFPIPECWIYLFRVEKHFRYGSVKSAHRRTGKIKGIERILGAVDTLQESLIEVTSGQAKYEHHHRAIVWRCPRLPKEGQGAYTTHQLVCRMALTSYDQIPAELAPYAFVEFTMPATYVSHTTVRSVSVQDSDSDEPPEKYVRYLARHEYRVGIETTHGSTVSAYASAAASAPPKETAADPKPAASPMPPSDSDSDSN